MKSSPTVKGSADAKKSVAGPRPGPPSKEDTSMEIRPTFTLTFSLGTSMREIRDSVIRIVSQQTGCDRQEVARLLQINRRTILRRMGRREDL